MPIVPFPAPSESSATSVDREGASERVERSYVCDACGESFAGRPAGAGLFLWTRGDEIRYEEPPLCDECAERITLGALLRWSVGEEEEEG